MHTPNISIITPSYNRPLLLERMIQSVLSQTYTDWELLVIDDSTNLESNKLMQKYQNDPQITYLKNHQNQGLPYSRSRGLDIARGTWITFLDDDDLYVDSLCLEKTSKILESDSSPWFVFNRVDVSGYSFTKALKEKKSYNWLTDYLYGNSFRGDAVHFIKKNLIDTTRYQEAHRAEWDFWFNLAKKSNFVYHPIPIVQAEYLPDGMSNLGYLQKEQIYQGQQFREMIKSTSTWKYVPIIAKRYVASFVPVRKLINRLRNKQTAH